MIHRRILLQRVQLTGVHRDDGAAGEDLLDGEVVAADERGDFRAGAVNDHVHRLRARRELVGKVRAQTGAVRSVRRSGNEQRGREAHPGERATRRRAQQTEGHHTELRGSQEKRLRDGAPSNECARMVESVGGRGAVTG